MKRRKFTSQFKTKVVLDALKERQSAKELAEKYKLSPQQISSWKREFLDLTDQVFGSKNTNKNGRRGEER